MPETSEIGIVETPEPKTYTVSLQATFAPETRLSFDTTNGVGKWDSTDKVALFTQNRKLVIGNIRGDFDEDSPTFTFTLEDDDKIVDGATVYYPASIAVENYPDQIVLPASYTDLDVMRKTIPMKATVNGKNMAFQHLASMVYVDAPTSTPRTPAGDNGTEIRAKWDAGKGYCFVMPATTYSEGFSFSIISDITNVEGKDVYFTFYRKTRSSSFAAQRARMLKMPAFDPQCKEFYGAFNLISYEQAFPVGFLITEMLFQKRNSRIVQIKLFIQYTELYNRLGHTEIIQHKLYQLISSFDQLIFRSPIALYDLYDLRLAFQYIVLKLLKHFKEQSFLRSETVIDHSQINTGFFRYSSGRNIRPLITCKEELAGSGLESSFS